MSAQEKITELLFEACPEHRRDDLAALLDAFPFVAAELVNEPVWIAAIYDRSEKRIYMRNSIVALSMYEVLGCYLHEVVHAGGWSGREMHFHNAAFSAALDDIFDHFGIQQTAKGRSYSLRDEHDAWRARQVSSVSLFAVFCAVGCCMYAIYLRNFEAAAWAGVAGFAFAWIEKSRQAMAGKLPGDWR